MKYFLCTALLCLSLFEGWAFGDKISLGLESETGKRYDLKLSKAGRSILDKNFHITSLKTNADGKVFREVWRPSVEELKSSQNVYLDQENLAVVRFNADKTAGGLEGVVDSMKISSLNGVNVLTQTATGNRSDYIDLGRKLTYSSGSPQADVKGDVELLLVVDKEFGDKFDHDLVRMLDYLTVYFWDVNLRYKTLPSVDLAFRITHVLAISDTNSQPFIEEARAEDGRAEFGRILDRFAPWVYTQIDGVPKFDMAALITNTALEWGGGLAYVGAACSVDHGSRRHWGTTVFNDGGNWGSLTVGAHEIGHVLGAPHDDDPNYPGGCDDRGYIMSGGTDELRWFFSTCSDRTISSYARSDQGSCLRQIDQEGNLPISPDFSFIKAPDMDTQCKMHLGPNGFIEEGDTGNCKSMRCLVPFEDGGGWWIYQIAPVDNTICQGGGRCFRGRCLKEGVLIQNVGSGQCLWKPNKFDPYYTTIEMVECNRLGTPLDRFVIMDNGQSGQMLATPYQSPDASENADACIWAGSGEGNPMMTDRCDTANPWHGWDFVELGNGDKLIKHKVTGRCAKQDGGQVPTVSNCDGNDASLRWKLV